MATAAASRFRFLTMAAALTLAAGLLVATPAAADDAPVEAPPAVAPTEIAADASTAEATESAPPADESSSPPAESAPVTVAPVEGSAVPTPTPEQTASDPDSAQTAPPSQDSDDADATVAQDAQSVESTETTASPSARTVSQVGAAAARSGAGSYQVTAVEYERAWGEAPWLGRSIGTASLSNAGWIPGQAVTVSATYTHPMEQCSDDGSETPTYSSGTRVSISWVGAELVPGSVSPSPGTLPYSTSAGGGGYIWAFPESVEWIASSSNRTYGHADPSIGIPPGAGFSATFIAPSDPYGVRRDPYVSFVGGAMAPDHCGGIELNPLVIIRGGGAVTAGGSDLPPIPEFTWAPDAADPFEIEFSNTSRDETTPFELLVFSWEFGDGAVSAQAHPTHRYEHPGRYDVRLTVTDGGGQTASVTRVVEIGGDLVVNSTADLPAEDPAVGCDTGGTVGSTEAPECTLRAAIEAANAAGGGEISFDIEGSPVIALGAALPAITTPTTIDGTTQSGGWVEVDGVPGSDLLTIAGGPVTATGLALHDTRFAIVISGGSDHVLEGLRIGTDLGGTATGDTTVGVLVGAGSGSRVADSTISAARAGVLISGAGSVGATTVEGNAIGATPAGAANGDVEIGVISLGAPTSIDGNLIRTTKFGVMVAGAEAAGTSVTGNRVGTSGTAPFDGVGTGIVVEGIPDAVVTGNTVHASEWGGILVAGGVMVESAEGEFVFHSPTNTDFVAPATSSGVVIGDNVVTTVEESPGIASWAGADAIEVTGNTVAADDTGIELEGGGEHVVTGNTLGSATELLPGIGIRLSDSAAPRISGNTVFATEQGIVVRRDGAGAEITGNSITGDPAGLTIGIEVLGERSGVEVSGNTVTGAGRTGIHLDVVGGRVTGNVVVDGGDGIRLDDGAGNEVRDNLVGATAGLGSLPGNRGTGIEVNGGTAVIRGNTVVGSGEAGIDVDDDASATLRGNRIWDSTGAPIATTIEPLNLVGAIIADTEGQRRTTLVITGLPDGTGTIEVFANDSCGPDGGEARVVTDIRRQTVAGRDAQIIQVLGSHDHFTITFTGADGKTGDLSDCVDRETLADSDGDGSPDPLDGLMHAEADPGIAVIATTDEQLLVMIASEGDIEGLSIIDDPAPSGHPADWSLPYGTFSFRVTGLEPGGSTGIVLTTYFQDAVLAGTGYWKYGPPTPGAAPSWYDFALDESGTGAARTSANIPGLGYRVTFALSLTDGARGDADNIQNGSIADPGGPVSASVSTTTPPPIMTPPAPAALSATGSTTPPATAPIWIAVIAVLLGAAIVRATARSNRKAMRRAT